MHRLRIFGLGNTLGPMEDDDSSSDERRAPLPTLSEVVYTPPNPDGSNKACKNCVFYATGRGQCYIHSPGLTIAPLAVCGYHVFCFAPMRIFTSVVKMLPLTPEQSGLIETTAGTSCDSCCYFAASKGEGQNGECMATVDEHGMPAAVEAKGCCARYDQKEEMLVDIVLGPNALQAESGDEDEDTDSGEYELED